MADAPPSSSPKDALSRFLATYPTFIQEKIKCIFDKLDVKGVLQFWAPVRTAGGRWLLTTYNQPFAIAENSYGGKKYRSCSVRYAYNLDMDNLEVEEDPTIISNGAPARAFLNRLPELLPDLRAHRMTPLESSAMQCGFFRSVMVPVFYDEKHFPERCLGVVECCSSSSCLLDDMFKDLLHELDREDLEKFEELPPFDTMRAHYHVKEVINKALDVIWTEFRFDLVQVWITYKDEKHVPFSSSLEDNPTERMLGVKLMDRIRDHESYDDDYVSQCFIHYSSICNKLHLEMGEGLIGKALKNRKPHFMKKVSKLSDNQPLMMVRRSYGEGDPFECSCFVICLRTIETGDVDYVFEFLWHEVPNYATLLESLLLSLKRGLCGFKYASGGELGDELPIIYVEDSTKSKTKVFRIFKGISSASASGSGALEKSSVVGKECLTPLEAKCKTTPIPLSEEGMVEAAEKLYVSLSTTLKRKREDQSNTNEEASQDPSANNREMCLNENTLTIKAEHADDMIKFTLPISSATFVGIEKEIGKGFELNPANYKLKYLDEDGDWILLKSDEDVKVCIKGRRNLSSIVRLRLLPRQPSDPSHTYQAT